MEIKTLADLRKRTAKILSYMDKHYSCDIMYGRITLARNLLSKLYKKDIPLNTKIRLAQEIINTTAYEHNDKFNII